MIDVSQLEFAYSKGNFKLHIDRFSVATGSCVALIGPSGSGKSTLLHLIAGILSPASGRIVVDDCDLSSLNESARRDFRIAKIGLIFQEFELLEYLQVHDNMQLPFRINASLQLTHEVKTRVQQLAKNLEIEDKLACFPDQLSQGEKQRAACGHG